MKYVDVVESGVLFFRQRTLLLDLGQNALQSNQLVTKLDLYEIEKKQYAYLKKISVKYPYAQGKQKMAKKPQKDIKENTGTLEIWPKHRKIL